MFPEFVSSYMSGQWSAFTAEIFTLHFYVALLGIVGIDILLSGDNALVIAAVTGKLPREQRRIGVIVGSTLAVVLRVGLAVVASALISLPFLAMLGGIYLLYVAYELIAPKGEDGDHGAAGSLWGAILKIGLLDVSMSLDNVLSISAMSHGSASLMVIGIALSIPMVIFFSMLISFMLERYPALNWIGAILLGVVAAKVIAHDSAVVDYFMVDSDTISYTLMPMAVLGVLGSAFLSRLMHYERRDEVVGF